MASREEIENLKENVWAAYDRLGAYYFDVMTEVEGADEELYNAMDELAEALGGFRAPDVHWPDISAAMEYEFERLYDDLVDLFGPPPPPREGYGVSGS